MNVLIDTELDSLLASFYREGLFERFKIVPNGYYDKQKKKSVFVAVGIGRNDPCLCGSGKKFKQCCIDK